MDGTGWSVATFHIRSATVTQNAPALTSIFVLGTEHKSLAPATRAFGACGGRSEAEGLAGSRISKFFKVNQFPETKAPARVDAMSETVTVIGWYLYVWLGAMPSYAISGQSSSRGRN